MIELDGTHGEGGGQILRGALALALATKQAFRVRNIRANRSKPGLMRQHLTAVKAAAAVGEAEVVGAELGSRELIFSPSANPQTQAEYVFDIGSAGGTMSVLQAVLPALARHSKWSEPANTGERGPDVALQTREQRGGVNRRDLRPTRGDGKVPCGSTSQYACSFTVIGGTHNPLAPPFEFIDEALLPQLRKIGWDVHARLDRPGFIPVGGGKVVVSIAAAKPAIPYDLQQRGKLLAIEPWILHARLPREIAQRELAALRSHLLACDDVAVGAGEIRDASSAACPGNMLAVTLRYEHVTEVVSVLGEKQKRGEVLASELAKEANQFMHHVAKAPVGEYLADQLMVPLAVSAGGTFVATTWSDHCESQCEIIAKFTGARPRVERAADCVRVVVEPLTI